MSIFFLKQVEPTDDDKTWEISGLSLSEDEKNILLPILAKQGHTIKEVSND